MNFEENKEEQEPIELLPNPERVMNGLRDTGYDFNTAIADIVDNSIAANATKVNIAIQLDPTQNVVIYICDNGTGMNEKELINAMKYGSDRRANPSSLGKFGLGLKTASTAFCKCLSVISRNKEDSEIRKVQWDLDYIATINGWKLKRPKPTLDEIDMLNSITEEQSGTLVVWEKVDRLIRDYSRRGDAENALNKIIEKLKFHLSLTYQYFLEQSTDHKDIIELNLNGQPIIPWDPFCKDISELLFRNNLPIEINDENTELKIEAYLLPRKEEFASEEREKEAHLTNDLQGFYIFRENRLIHYGDWLGMWTKEPHGTLLRVKLSFTHELDEAFNVDIKKSRILLDDTIYNTIKELITPLRRAANEKYRKGTRKDISTAGANAHDASNRNIDEKAPGIEDAKITVEDESNNEVQVKNPNGTFNHKITIRQPLKPGQYRVIPVESLDDGVLWNPCITEGKLAVEINQGHPYYQKIYYPILEQNVMVIGMDALLWALSEAELSTMNDDTKEHYEDIRFQVSRYLKKLLADLPDPEIKNED